MPVIRPLQKREPMLLKKSMQMLKHFNYTCLSMLWNHITFACSRMSNISAIMIAKCEKVQFFPLAQWSESVNFGALSDEFYKLYQ